MSTQRTTSNAGLVKVSVLMVTRNHSAFIDQAIQSALTQDISALIEVIVSDDASTDDTFEKVRGWAIRDARVIGARHERQVGVFHNVQRALSRCRGEYVAFLDGDDYWLDPSKLSRQVRFLETHREYVGVFENVLLVNEMGDSLRIHVPESTVADRAGLASAYLLTTQTLMLRRVCASSLPTWAEATNFVDWALAFEASLHGDIAHCNFLSAAYRQTRHGVSSSLAQHTRFRQTTDFLLLLRHRLSVDALQHACEQQYVTSYAAFRNHVDSSGANATALLLAWQIARLCSVKERWLVFPKLCAWVLITGLSNARRSLALAISRHRADL